jgi:tRNA A-37 threonylcarbamoyl transferase component Bud32
MPDPVGSGSPARVLSGRYRLGAVLGRGGASTVYRARDTLLGRDVAIKLFAASAVRPEDLQAQQSEARLLGSLSHPGLVMLLDAGVDFDAKGDPQVYLVMELVGGSDLRERLRHGALDVVETAYLGWDILTALDHIHQVGIVHRDIKPANVLLVETRHRPPHAKLADFGIALLRADQAEPGEFTTGTAAYLSPEQVEGRLLGPESDVYSFGLVLIEAFTGRACFPGGVTDSALARLDRDPVIPTELPHDLGQMLRRMTARSASDRPSAGEAMEPFRAQVAQVLGAAEPVRDPEAERLQAVQRYSLLDTPPDAAFDRVTALATRLFSVPMAIVTVVGEDRIWLKSHHGIEVEEVQRQRGFAMSGGLHDETLVIEDTTTDPRMASAPSSTGDDGIRFFAGVPLITPDGQNLGSLAILDREPHSFPPESVATLEDLAAMVLHEMELRLATRRIVLGREPGQPQRRAAAG